MNLHKYYVPRLKLAYFSICIIIEWGLERHANP